MQVIKSDSNFGKKQRIPNLALMPLDVGEFLERSKFCKLIGKQKNINLGETPHLTTSEMSEMLYVGEATHVTTARISQRKKREK